MVASNTRDCFREFVGKRVIGVLFDALPIGRDDLSAGCKTLIFEDGRGLTIANNGSFWIDGPKDVALAIQKRADELRAVSGELQDVLKLAGQKP